MKKFLYIMGFLYVVLYINYLINGTPVSEEGPPINTPHQNVEKNNFIDMLTHAVSKNSSNTAVICQENNVENRKYIMCEYSLFEISGRRMKALFLVDGQHLYAINGTAKQSSMLKYDEISEYDVSTMGSIGVSDIIDTFK